MPLSRPETFKKNWFSIDFRVARLDEVQTGKALLGQMKSALELPWGLLKGWRSCVTLWMIKLSMLVCSHINIRVGHNACRL